MPSDSSCPAPTPLPEQKQTLGRTSLALVLKTLHVGQQDGLTLPKQNTAPGVHWGGDSEYLRRI